MAEPRAAGASWPPGRGQRGAAAQAAATSTEAETLPGRRQGRRLAVSCGGLWWHHLAPQDDVLSLRGSETGLRGEPCERGGGPRGEPREGPRGAAVAAGPGERPAPHGGQLREGAVAARRRERSEPRGGPADPAQGSGNTASSAAGRGRGGWQWLRSTGGCGELGRPGAESEASQRAGGRRPFSAGATTSAASEQSSARRHLRPSGGGLAQVGVWSLWQAPAAARAHDGQCRARTRAKDAAEEDAEEDAKPERTPGDEGRLPGTQEGAHAAERSATAGSTASSAGRRREAEGGAEGGADGGAEGGAERGAAAGDSFALPPGAAWGTPMFSNMGAPGAAHTATGQQCGGGRALGPSGTAAAIPAPARLWVAGCFPAVPVPMLAAPILLFPVGWHESAQQQLRQPAGERQSGAEAQPQPQAGVAWQEAQTGLEGAFCADRQRRAPAANCGPASGAPGSAQEECREAWPRDAGFDNPGGGDHGPSWARRATRRSWPSRTRT